MRENDGSESERLRESESFARKTGEALADEAFTGQETKESEEAEYKAELESVRSSIQKAALRNSELKQTLSDVNKNLVVVFPKVKEVETKPLHGRRRLKFSG